MKHGVMIGTFLGSGLLAITSWAAIPIPGVVLYGPVFIDQQYQEPEDEVTVVARVDGVDNPVGSYHLGDTARADGFYVLRIRLRSSADGSSQDPGDNFALVGQTVHLLTQQGSGDEQPVMDFVIGAQGHIQYLELGAHVPGDWNGDMQVSIEDYPYFEECMQGQGTGGTADCRAIFDSNTDGDIDLRDFQSWQAAFANSK